MSFVGQALSVGGSSASFGSLGGGGLSIEVCRWVLRRKEQVQWMDFSGCLASSEKGAIDGLEYFRKAQKFGRITCND